jgi:hypothetical protein
MLSKLSEDLAGKGITLRLAEMINARMPGFISLSHFFNLCVLCDLCGNNFFLLV